MNYIYNPLEKEKLKLEISELKKPWYKKPEVYFSTFPTLLAIGSLILVFNSGILDSKEALLELNKKKLEIDIANFTSDKNNLIKVKDSLNKNIEELKAKQLGLINEIAIQAVENHVETEKHKIEIKESYQKGRIDEKKICEEKYNSNNP